MSVTHKNTVYVLGGWDGYDCLRSVEKADLAKGESVRFKETKPLLSPVKNGCCVYNETNKTIYIIGGWDEKETTKSIFAYEPNNKDNTFFVGSLPEPVEGHSLARVGDYVYIIGGFDGYGVVDRIMRMNIQTRHTEVLKDVKLLEKRENCTSEVIFDAEEGGD